MTALLYFMVAVTAVTLPTQAWWADREDPPRVAFLGLGWALGLSYGAFALSLLPGLGEVRILYTMAGCFVPPTLLRVIDRIFIRESPPSRWTPALFASAVVVAPLAGLVHLAFYQGTPRASIPEVIAGATASIGFIAVFLRLHQAHEDAALRVEKTRIRYLQAVLGSAVVFTLAEQLARGLGSPVDPAHLSLASRGVALQGAIPPFSVVLAGIALYFLFHSVKAYRLLDLQEVFSRAAILLASALLLLLVDGITFIWVDTFTVYPFHSTFQIFLASLMFLASYDPLRESISYATNRVLNQRGQQLADALDHMRARIPKAIHIEALIPEVLDPLHASGRVPACSVYLWDPHLDAFRLAGHRGRHEQEPIEAVSTLPFTAGFAAGSPWYIRAAIQRRARADAEQAERLALMDAMNADLTLPFFSSGAVIGWLHLSHEGWSDGFSLDEMQRLSDIAQLVSVVLSNIQDFEALEQAHRLAALGRMSAGLAHEIRNPLAGVKGAAQYLQGEELPEASKDMLQVIIDEVNRLDIVVSQFLDYARPVELNLQNDHVNSVVAHALTLTRARGAPNAIQISEDLAGDLPAFPIDATRLSQVLLNLIHNALQAMPDGGALTVRTRLQKTRAGDPQLELAVEDTGRGIPMDSLDDIFIPFFTTRDEGTGLGLPICQRIAEAHGGHLDVHSAEGRGTTFLLRLPIPTTERPTEADPDGDANTRDDEADA